MKPGGASVPAAQVAARWPTRMRAPGKLVLLGDYAVLAGATALVAAVDRFATGSASAFSSEASSVVEGVKEAAVRRGLAVPPHIRISTEELRDEGQKKLGLGSSSAVANVAAAVITQRVDESTLELALEGHSIATSGRGSGIDVAAAFWGGVIATARQPSRVERLSLGLPGLELGVYFAGESAATADMVAAVQATSAWARFSRELVLSSEEGLVAYREGDAERFLAIVRRYGRQLEAMGDAAEVPIVSEPIRRVMDVADGLGAAAKPSGAGGGDVIVAWARSEADLDEIGRLAGVRRLSLHVGSRGTSEAGTP